MKSEAPDMPYFEKIGAHLYRVRGRVHGYLLCRGERALCVDPGPGEWVEHLDELGVRAVDVVLATHHHRDTLANAGRLVARGAVLAAPAAEADRIAQADLFWRNARTFMLYDCDSDFFSLREAVPVELPLRVGQKADLRGWHANALELQGHTAGSMAYVLEHEGSRLAFVGDNLSAPGLVHDLHDFQYEYMGFNQGTKALRERLCKLRDARPDRLLPAHGGPLDDPPGALNLLEVNLDRHIAAVQPNRLKRPVDELRQISPHVFFVQCTTYLLLGPEGRGFFWDYGYVQEDRVQRLADEFGLKEVGVVSFSHYHDDHLARALEVTERHLPQGTRHPRRAQLWCHRLLHDILTRPLAWRLPAVWPQPLPLDRVYGDETIEWGGYRLEFFEFPGQTHYHVGLVAEVDGRRYAFTGDNIWKRADEGRSLTSPIIARNRYFLEKGYEFSARQLLDRRVDFICPAHGDAFPVTRADLEAYLEWARETSAAIRALCPEAPLGLDPWWCRFDPFHIFSDKQGDAEFRVVVESPFAKPVRLRLRPAHAARLTVEPAERVLDIPARAAAAAEFVLHLREELPPGERVPITAGLSVDGVEWGEIGEGLVLTKPR